MLKQRLGAPVNLQEAGPVSHRSSHCGDNEHTNVIRHTGNADLVLDHINRGRKLPFRRLNSIREDSDCKQHESEQLRRIGALVRNQTM